MSEGIQTDLNAIDSSLYTLRKSASLSELPDLEDGGYGHPPVDDYQIPRYDFSGQTAIVTGASQGIGRHIAIGLTRSGANVVIASRSKGGPETAYMIANDSKSVEAGGVAHFIECDVSVEDEVDAMTKLTVEKFGGLHMAVNNAGHSGVNAPIEKQTTQNFDDVFNTNARGAFFCMKSQIAEMRKNDAPAGRATAEDSDEDHGATSERSGYGRIVNIGSAAAFIAFPTAGIYVASKHALWGLTQAAAVELAPDTDIRVNMVVPGSVKTNNYEIFSEGKDAMKKQMISSHATQQILMPEDCVAATLFMLSRGAFFCVGSALKIDGGYTAL